MKNLLIGILLIISVASIAYAAVTMKKTSKMDAEISQLKTEKIALLAEHEKCLEYKEQSLRKELMTKYLDSIVALLNRIETGHKPTKEETENFYDRIDFIAQNIESAAVSKEEISLVLNFIDSAKKTFETKTKTPSETDKK